MSKGPRGLTAGSYLHVSGHFWLQMEPNETLLYYLVLMPDINVCTDATEQAGFRRL